MTVVKTIIYVIFMFVVIIVPHELGHFAVAKSVGIRVNEFAFGMGPAIFKKQKGETLYSIRAIPIGGYCAMEGENEESDNSRAFNNKPGWQKILVLIAGATMNVIVTVLIFSIMVGYIGDATTTIEEVTKDSPAYEAGIIKGDKIISVNGNKIDKWSEITNYIGTSENKIGIVIKRGSKELEFTPIPEKNEDGRIIIGITPKVTHNPFVAIKNGGKATLNMTKSMYKALKMLVTGESSIKEVSGPVGMIAMVNDTNIYGLWYYGYLLALISLNLAIINMLPFPALDGGRILFVIIRKATGKMISDDLEGKIHGIGMALLILFMILITWNDIFK